MPDDTRDTPVLHERRGPVAYATTNRPRYRNAETAADSPGGPDVAAMKEASTP